MNEPDDYARLESQHDFARISGMKIDYVRSTTGIWESQITYSNRRWVAIGNTREQATRNNLLQEAQRGAEAMTPSPIPAVPSDGPTSGWLPTGVWWDGGTFYWWDGSQWTVYIDGEWQPLEPEPQWETS